MLIVIDEAHNICAPNPATAVERALTMQLVQIAAEGRKFGLCLMQMNSPRTSPTWPMCSGSRPQSC